jgi:hypothetical protein
MADSSCRRIARRYLVRPKPKPTRTGDHGEEADCRGITPGSTRAMTDQSAEHGRRIDEELDHEVEGLVRGAPVDTRAQEGLEPELSEILVTTPLGDPEADQEHRELLERSEVARFLRPSAFPTDARGLLDVAREEHATDEVLAELGRLPTNVQFATMAEIWEALGHEVEHRPRARDADTTESEPAEPDAREPEAPESRVAAPVEVLRPEPAIEAPATATSLEDSRLHPLRGAIGFGLELVRAVLSTAERVVAEVQERLER